MKATGSAAVMASRNEPDDSLDYFPTPPWATRALCEYVLPAIGESREAMRTQSVWEPACGEGHMAEPLREYFGRVRATDVFPYGYSDEGVHDFVAFAPTVTPAGNPDWIVTNPPFNRAADFAAKALWRASRGVALLVRNQWIEGVKRYETLFGPFPPAVVAPFVERVPMVKGRWDPTATTATAYSWFVWTLPIATHAMGTRVLWIPPGCRKRLTRDDDVRRFAGARDAV